jgi:DNA-binding response OmpR family regulator
MSSLPPADRRHVLVIDDEPYIGRIIQLKLEQGPYVVALAGDAEAARTHFRSAAQIDLVLMDIMLREASGFELLAELRRTPHRQKTPVVMLSAKGEADDRERAAELGATDFLIKPFSPKKLLARIDELLAR